MSTNEIIHALEMGTARIAELNALLKEDRAELARLRAELAVAENWVEHHSQHADDLIAENVKLRADLERFTGHGLLDCHAICDQRDAAVAERDRLRAEVERLDAEKPWLKEANARAAHAEAELAKDKARLDWLDMNRRLEQGNCDRNSRSWYLLSVPTGYDYYKGGVDLPLRAAIDAAMKASEV